MEAFNIILGMFMIYTFIHSYVISISRSKTIYEKIITIASAVFLTLFIIWSTV